MQIFTYIARYRLISAYMPRYTLIPSDINNAYINTRTHPEGTRFVGRPFPEVMQDALVSGI